MITAAEARTLYQIRVAKETEIVLEKIGASIRKASANKIRIISWHNNELSSEIIEELKKSGYTLITIGYYTHIKW